MRDFREIKVWEKAHALTLEIYKASAGFPQEEIYGLTSQMRRSSSSIPANIAEGCARSGRTEFRQFLYISAGSASELDYLLLLGRDLHLLTEKQYEALYSSLYEVRRMLTGLIERLSISSNNPPSRDTRNVTQAAHPQPTVLAETKN